MNLPLLTGRLARTLPAGLVVLLYGCAAGPDAGGTAGSGATPDSSGSPSATFVDARPAALVDGRSVTWGELRETLTEIGGAQALDEFILDMKVAQSLEAAGLSVDATDMQRESQLLIEQLDRNDPNRALRMLEEVRARRGLGPRRYEALLRRNAGLRALVRPGIEISPGMVQQQYELRYGARRQARIIVLPSLYDAQRAVEALSRGTASFNEVATRQSTDASASRGGLLEPISRADPTYPDALRRVLWELRIGQISRPILVDSQYAVLKLESETPAEQVPIEEVRAELKDEARLVQERLAMDRLALQLISDVQLSIFDEALNDSWRLARRARGQTAVTTGVQR
ncbi:MAG: peptidylprolyl isomerase [Planctomycetota bacterium]|jgi:parvulin-like peptidyl-prolyl isomerase